MTTPSLGSSTPTPFSIQFETNYKTYLRNHCLSYTLSDFIIPELGAVKKGKVRDIYFSPNYVYMVSSDRVSAFDCVLSNLIPFKGQLLNRISCWAFKQTEDIVPNALVTASSLESPFKIVGGHGGSQNLPTSVSSLSAGQLMMDPNVLIQKRLEPIQVECIVRGYLWGSMASAYENGERTFCGLSLPEGMLRFQKLRAPIFTPTTKAPYGEHDENISLEEMTNIVGSKDLAEKLRNFSLQMYDRGCMLAEQKGLLFLDTKYEFGVDPKTGEVVVMDEVNTPDSSRLCDTHEWESKFKAIEDCMKKKNKGEYKNVTELINVKKDLKVKEFSKQYVRDVLLEQGFDSKKDKKPKLTPEQVVECAYRYICVYERITGERWEFPDMTILPGKRLVAALAKRKFIKGCAAILMAGSDSDASHLEKIQAALTSYQIPSFVRICSAHKQCSKLESLIEYYNRSVEPLLIIACAGGTDALSGSASFSSVFPVVSCPPDGMNSSCLHNPPQSSNAFILRPDNVAKFAAQMFSFVNDEYRQRCLEKIAAKVETLLRADEAFVANPSPVSLS